MKKKKQTEEQRLYKEHLKEVQKKNPKVNYVMDFTPQEANWLHHGKKDEKKK